VSKDRDCLRALLDGCQLYQIKTEYLGGDSVRYVEPIKEPRIAECSFMTVEELRRKKELLAEQNNLKTTREKLWREYKTKLDACDKALADLREDRLDCIDRLRAATKAKDTYDEYIGMLDGDSVKAIAFLEKVITEDDMKAAIEVFGHVENWSVGSDF
jgi:hypothetical protein